MTSSAVGATIAFGGPGVAANLVHDRGAGKQQKNPERPPRTETASGALHPFPPAPLPPTADWIVSLLRLPQNGQPANRLGRVQTTAQSQSLENPRIAGKSR